MLKKDLFIALKQVLIVLCLAAPLASCAYEKPLEPTPDFIPCGTNWLYTTDLSDPESYQPITSREELPLLSLKLPNHKGTIYLIHYFQLPSSMPTNDLKFFLGRARLADRVYLNGAFIGGGGHFPPDIFSAGHGARSYQIPQNILRRREDNVLVVELYLNGSGGLYSQCGIGLSSTVNLKTEAETFIHSRINMVFSFIMVLVALFYLFIFLARTKAKENLFYSLLNLFSSLFLLSFCISEMPALTPSFISFNTFSKIFVMEAALIVAFFATSFARSFLHDPCPTNLRILRFAMLIVPSVMLLYIPDYDTFRRAEPFFFVLVGLQIVFAVVPAVRAFRQKNRDVYTLIAGFVPVYIGVIIDTIVHIILRNTSAPLYTIYGWQGTIIAYLIILALRLTKLHAQVEYLNRTLESEVQERTRELVKTNKALEEKNEQHRRDIEYAISIQKSFLPPPPDALENYDVAHKYEPLSGVSGDLYSYFTNESKTELAGVAVFDVSGHGIGSALVTLLAKSVIDERFGRERPLNRIMEDISKEIIAKKGSLENYLTGILFRLGGNGDAELVNAGSPPPIQAFANGKPAEELLPPAGEVQYGMIGNRNVDVSFAVTPVHLDKGDAIILYTDGIIEATDNHGIQFGRDMLKSVFQNAMEKAPDATAKELAKAVREGLARFTKSTPLHDDLTLVVVKRK